MDLGRSLIDGRWNVGFATPAGGGQEQEYGGSNDKTGHVTLSAKRVTRPAEHDAGDLFDTNQTCVGWQTLQPVTKKLRSEALQPGSQTRELA